LGIVIIASFFGQCMQVVGAASQAFRIVHYNPFGIMAGQNRQLRAGMIFPNILLSQVLLERKGSLLVHGH
jgi:hypothetical protein